VIGSAWLDRVCLYLANALTGRRPA